MNNKHVKDRVYNCKGCGVHIPFKGYSQNHVYCSIRCQATHRKKLTAEKAKSQFENGELTSRQKIYVLLVERDGDKCRCCGLTDWNNKPIRLWVDHIDGNASNNQPTNFRLICPNCDSQSDTFGAKNYGNGRKSKGLPQYG